MKGIMDFYKLSLFILHVYLRFSSSLEDVNQLEPEIVTLADTNSNKWTDWINQGWRKQSLELGKVKAFMACNNHIWLRTPFIQRYEAKEIFIHIEFSNLLADENFNKTKILLTEANSSQELKEEISENDFINSSTVKSNKKSENGEKFSYIGRKDDTITISEQIVRFQLTQNKKGFAIAFESKYSCLVLFRIHVFYKICPTLQDNFAEFPKTVAGSVDTRVEGSCLPGAGQLPSHLPPIRICNRDGYWLEDKRRSDSLHAECQCLPGFAATTDRKSSSCRVCSQGEYKYKMGPSECLKCPENSVSSKVAYDFVEEEVKQLQLINPIPGFVSCSCLPRFYRNSAVDKFTDPCTSLPSHPQNLEADVTNVAKVVIKWSPPSQLGGRQNSINYRVECRIVEKNFKKSCGKSIIIENDPIRNNQILVHGLSSKETYEFSVISLNELSDLPNIDLSYSTSTINVEIPKPVPIEVFNLRATKMKQENIENKTMNPQGGLIFVTWDPPIDTSEQSEIQVDEYEVNVLIENGTDITGRVMMGLFVYFMEKRQFYFPAVPNKTIIVKVRPKIKNGPWATFKSTPEIILRPDDELLTSNDIPIWISKTSIKPNNSSLHTVFQKNHKLLVILFSIGFVVFCLFIFCAVFSLYRRFRKPEKCLVNENMNEMSKNINGQLPHQNIHNTLMHLNDGGGGTMMIHPENKRNFYAASSSMTNSSTNHSKSDKNSLQELIMQNKNSLALDEKKYLMDSNKNLLNSPVQYMSTPGGNSSISKKNSKANNNPRNNSDSGNSSRDIDCQIENLDDEMPIYNESMMYEEAQISYGNEIDPNCVYNSVVIGSGEFGEVCRAYMKTLSMDKPKVVAIKTLKPSANRKEREDFLAEALIISQLRHPHIVSLEGVVTMTDPIMIIFEYMENHSLDKYLRANRGNIFVVKLVKILSGIASAMSYIVDSGYIHRDLAARNILVNDQMVCKVSDFGLSRKIDFEDSDDASYTTMGGKIPVRWTAPEAITHRKFSASSDVWSFGILSWEVMSMGERPYWNWSNQAVLEAVESGYRLPNPIGCPQMIHQLMMKCWQANRLDRPTFCDIEMQLEKIIQLESENNMNPQNPFSFMQTPLMFNGTNHRQPFSMQHYNTLDNHDIMNSGYQFDAWVIKSGLQNLSSRLKACGISSLEALQTTNFEDVQRLGIFTNRELKMLMFHISQNGPLPHNPNSNMPNFSNLISDVN